jgi:prepilin-type processing-associated H-X9-DG protein
MLDTVVEKEQARTNVVFADGHVEMMVTPDQLEKEFGVAFRPGVKTNVEVENQSSSAGSQVSAQRPEPGWVRSDRPGAAENDGALKFDGSRMYARIAPNPVLDIRDSLTLSAWVKNDGDDDGQIIWRGDNQGGMDPYELHITDSRMEFRINPLDGIFTSAVQSRQPVDDRWHLWTGVYDSQAKSISLYKDGQLEAAAETPVGFQYDTSTMWNMIGAVDFGNWQHFKGTIDEARIWIRALAPAEIQQQAQGIYPPNNPGLVAHWTFNNGQGNIIHDASGHNNHGQALSWTDPIGYIPPQKTRIDLAPAAFKMHYDEQRKTYSLVVSIKNEGTTTLPKHKIRYYLGDPEKGLDETGHPHTGWNEAGPIDPGGEWNEGTGGFLLPDGDYAFTVVLDYDNAIAETNEANNTATLEVEIQNGQIIEQQE